MPKVSILIPARNEPFLHKTINDLLTKAEGEIEIIVVLDGYWMENPIEDPRVIYIHIGRSKGMRNGINSAAAIAKGEFLMKADAHCMFGQGYDVKLASECEGNWVVVPRRYALDPEKWEIIDNPKYPIDYMYLSKDLHGEIWKEKNKDPELAKKLIDETMSNQGSVWFMPKSFFYHLDLMDESSYGTFWNEFQEVGLKCWLSGGKVMVNKNTWYAHWHKSSDFGRGYSLGSSQAEIGAAYTKRWPGNTAWHKQSLPFSWLVEHFWPVPSWPEDRKLWTP